MSTQAVKQALRQRIVTRREQLPAALRAQFSAAIAQRIAQMPEYRKAHTVLGYMNFGAEFESEIFAQQVLADDKVLLLPKVNRATNELDVYRVGNVDAQLAPGAYGIREPVAENCARQDLQEQMDFILLPGVAFGRDGARLGYGGGFYDKLIARLDAEGALTHRPVLIAAAYSIQVAEDIPMEATDRRIDWLVTESETIRCSGN